MDATTVSTSPTTFSFIDSDDKLDTDLTLTCPICFDEFDVPKFLSCCGRSICKNCEKRVTENRQSYDRRCPICNTRGGLSARSLPVNVDLKSKFRLLICSNRRLISEANDLLRSEKESPKNQKPTLICEECNEPMDVDKVYCCVRCDPKKKICPHCVIREHKTHQIEATVYLAKGRREELVTDITKKLVSAESLTFETMEFKKCLELSGANLRKARDICKEVIENDYQTQDDVDAKLNRAKTIIERVKKDYIKILDLKDSIMKLEQELEVDIDERC
uniref:RING-type domain-containing protein n=1 Tax=Steinernema glaseri TaxID=37863 RepID=A0A1I7ZI90_9BILA